MIFRVFWHERFDFPNHKLGVTKSSASERRAEMFDTTWLHKETQRQITVHFERQEDTDN